MKLDEVCREVRMLFGPAAYVFLRDGRRGVGLESIEVTGKTWDEAIGRMRRQLGTAPRRS